MTHHSAHRSVLLARFHARISRARTLDEAKQAAFVLWHLMADTREGWRCPFCNLIASDLDYDWHDDDPLLPGLDLMDPDS